MPERRREATQHLVQQGALSIAKACRLTRLSRRSWYRPDPSQHRLERDQPAFSVQRHIRGKWVCRQCQILTQAPVP